MNRSRRERGQVLPLVAVVLLLGGGLALLTGRVSSAAVERARARTAADAAALAGAAEGEDVARDVALANGGELVSYSTAGSDVAVVVRVGRAHAPARARRERGGDESWRSAGIRAGSPATVQGSEGVSLPPPSLPSSPPSPSSTPYRRAPPP